MRLAATLAMQTRLRLLMPSIAALRKQVKQADDAYRSGNPLMSDQDFDRLAAELRAAAPFAPELMLPGGGSALLSLNNGDREELEHWLALCGAQEPLCVSEKVDGCAIAIRYRLGQLEAAWTRSGADATALVARVAPKKLSQPLSIEVRGELFDSVTGKQSVPAQALRKPNHTGDGLDFIAYTLVDADGDEFLTLERLSALGFDTVSAVCCTTVADVIACHRQWKAGCFGRSELPTDGIVIRIAGHQAQQALGSGSKAPNYAFAMK